MKDAWIRPLEEYKGLLTRCAPGGHEAAVHLLLKHDVPRGPVLDLASGSGALAARLRDAGFGDIQCVDLDTGKFACPGMVPLSLDLNTSFADALDRRYAVVTATEIVEHLESPRNFLRNIRWVLLDDGYLLISTPNVATWKGRLKFLLTGELRYFDAEQYRVNHHISPITDTQMRLMLAETGFDLVEKITVGDFSGPLRRALLRPLDLLFRVLLRGDVCGEVNMYLARRAAAERPSTPADWTGAAGAG